MGEPASKLASELRWCLSVLADDAFYESRIAEAIRAAQARIEELERKNEALANAQRTMVALRAPAPPLEYFDEYPPGSRDG